MQNFIEKPVFICGHRKTGTTMLLCLLDNHPELLVYPEDSGFFYAYYPLAEERQWSDKRKIETVVKFCIGHLANAIYRLRPQDKQDLNFPMKDFIGKFRSRAQNSDKTTKAILTALMLAFQKIVGKEPDSIKYWVEKTTSSEIYALEIARWFPKAKFIHLIRDPRDNWASLKSGWNKYYRQFNDTPKRLLHSLLERGRLGMELAIHNQKILGKGRYLVLRFEDLVNQPKKNLLQICKFLQIDYQPTLLVPTILGKWWKGNNFEGKVFKGLSKVNVGKWKSRITSKEACLIEYYFLDLMKQFNYEPVSTLAQRMKAAADHYKWHNFAQKYSFRPEQIPKYLKGR